MEWERKNRYFARANGGTKNVSVWYYVSVDMSQKPPTFTAWAPRITREKPNPISYSKESADCYEACETHNQKRLQKAA